VEHKFFLQPAISFAGIFLNKNDQVIPPLKVGQSLAKKVPCLYAGGLGEATGSWLGALDHN
jgi:hypothetical protein